MKKRSMPIVVSVLCALTVFIIGIPKTRASNDFFYRNLIVGSTGLDVLELQRILNHSYTTRIAPTGSGSPGNETSYFGLLTQNAVIRFQNEHATEILVPNHSTVGSGAVGPYTNRVLNRLYASTTVVQATASASQPLIPPVISMYGTATTTPIDPANPNMRNVGVFFSAIDRVAAKKGISTQTVSRIKAQAMKDLATSTDYRKKFSESMKKKPTTVNMGAAGLFANVARSTIVAVAEFLTIHKAKADMFGEDRPFGGRVLFPFYCVCSENWIVLIEPYAPDYVALLTYTPFTQEYESYNIPFTEWLLGYYTEDGAVCDEYIPPYECVEIPAEGEITSKVGSSSY
jgi:peptidoglycan hydrolase-like protein with peptidoglycan-binding domain